jgi:hypothetical protein
VRSYPLPRFVYHLEIDHCADFSTRTGVANKAAGKFIVNRPAANYTLNIAAGCDRPHMAGERGAAAKSTYKGDNKWQMTTTDADMRDACVPWATTPSIAASIARTPRAAT